MSSRLTEMIQFLYGRQIMHFVEQGTTDPTIPAEFSRRWPDATETETKQAREMAFEMYAADESIKLERGLLPDPPPPEWYGGTSMIRRTGAISEYLNWLRQGSAGHAVRDRGDSVQVMPRDDSDEALRDFQSVAEEVVRRSFAGEFKIIPHHSIERGIPGQTGKPYDLVVVVPRGDGGLALRG